MMPELITGNTLRDEILMLVALGIRLNKATLTLLHHSTSYISVVLSNLKTEGYIKLSNTSPTVLSMTKKGTVLLQQMNTPLFQFYMHYSNNHHPGSTISHISTQTRAGDVLAVMYKANILIGTMKPSLETLIADQNAKLKKDTAIFCLNKELRYRVEQKEGRAQLSRSSGILWSPALTGLVYNTQDTTMNIARLAEREANIRLMQFSQEVYQDMPMRDPTDSIVIGTSFQTALQLLIDTPPSKKKTKTLGDAIKNQRITGTAFRFIPLDHNGVTLLQYLTTNSQRQILETVFTQAEIQAAEMQCEGDGIIDGLICFELLSSNISKLARIKQLYTSTKNIGIICWEPQMLLITRFLDTPNYKLRTLREDTLSTILLKQKEAYR